MAAGRIPPSSGHASIPRQSRRIVSPSRDDMIRAVAALVKGGGAMPTIAQVREAIGNITSADRWVTDEFGRYDLLFQEVRRYLENNLQSRVLIKVESAPPNFQSAAVAATPVHAPAAPAYTSVADGLNTILRIGLRVEDPVDILFLSRFWQTPALPNRLPTWAEWQATVQRESHKLVAYLEGLKMLDGRHDHEARRFARVSYHRVLTGSGLVVSDVSVQQSDNLQDLIPEAIQNGDGHIWFYRRDNPMFYDRVDSEGDGVNELKWQPPPPKVPHRRGYQVQAPDAEALEQVRRRLRRLLRGRPFDAVAMSRAEPLFTPAELKRVEPLVILPVTLRTDARGFAPTAVEWKDLSLKPSDTRFAGRSPSPLRGEGRGEGDHAFELLVIGLLSLIPTLHLMRNVPMESFGGGGVFFNSHSSAYPEEI